MGNELVPYDDDFILIFSKILDILSAINKGIRLYREVSKQRLRELEIELINTRRDKVSNYAFNMTRDNINKLRILCQELENYDCYQEPMRRQIDQLSRILEENVKKMVEEMERSLR